MGAKLPTLGSVRWGALLFVAAGTLLPLGYACYTNQVWEDYLITFRHSQNCCEGHGLVYRPGERVQGFTSPLGTLLPALCYWATGQQSGVAALWLFRGLSTLAFVGAGLLLLQGLRESGTGRFGLLALGTLYVLDAKAVAFAVNGMETAFVLLFLAWGLRLVFRDPSPRWLAFGICGAGLLWTRPDGCVVFAILALAALLFAEGSRQRLLAALLKSGLVCTVLYLPWFLWAWSYYGSPVPNTVRAKSSLLVPGDAVTHILDALLKLPGRTPAAFLPVYAQFGGWSPWVVVLANSLAFFAAAYWLFPVPDRPGRMASFVFLGLCAYLAFVPVYPWYLPPLTLCGLIVVVRGGLSYAETVRHAFAPAPVLARLLLLLLCAEGLWMFTQVARQMQIQQTEIEDQHRRQIGLWLKDHVPQGERVYLEALGYIGYYSEAKMLDYPGLVSPEVIRASSKGKPGFAPVGMRLQPEWMVLRPAEANEMSRQEGFRQQYQLVKVFDSTSRLNRYQDISGRGYLLHDAIFLIFQKIRSAR